ncbi:hypothetical protein [Hymenobacter pini]|uniref:hypothetical protein n=1 Tax=Hymenobacter pini TaxID=2880879 RepID=UPI001CF1F409|nr:hypothetical protein [Hymenobacter pini]MCA8831962.1 hypothetical protein [Hymenobacter pini]
MITNSIRLVDALQQMEEADSGFTLRFVKADRKRKKAGKIEEWHHCRLSRTTRQPRKKIVAAADAAPLASRQPSHFANATRNIVQGRSTQVRKVHIWLILAFNGKKVVLS